MTGHPQSSMPGQKISIQASQLGKTYEHPAGSVVALRDLSFQVHAGEFFCVLGPSGCGKSTLLHLLSGLESPSTGAVTIKPTSVGMVFQEHALFPWMTLERNLSFILDQQAPAQQAANRQLARRWLQKVGLEKFQHAYPHQVSGGMRQRAAVARSFAVQPALLLMDEPFVHLDYQTRMQLQQMLLTLWQEVGCSVVFVTHDIEEAVLLADRLMIMSRHPGTAKTVLQNDLPRPRHLLDLKTNARFIDLVEQSIGVIRDELQAVD